MNSPKKRFIVEGYRHIGVATSSPKAPNGNPLAKLGPYKSRSFPSNSTSKKLKNKPRNQDSFSRSNDNNKLMMLASGSYIDESFGGENGDSMMPSSTKRLNEINIITPPLSFQNHQHTNDPHDSRITSTKKRIKSPAIYYKIADTPKFGPKLYIKGKSSHKK